MAILSVALFFKVLSLIGVYYFTSGFFLTKTELSQKSTCTLHSAEELLTASPLLLTIKDVEALTDAGVLSSNWGERGRKKGGEGDNELDSTTGLQRRRKVHEGDVEKGAAHGCWQPRLVDYVIIVVVDALRFDFALEHLPRTLKKVSQMEIAGFYYDE